MKTKVTFIVYRSLSIKNKVRTNDKIDTKNIKVIKLIFLSAYFSVRIGSV